MSNKSNILLFTLFMASSLWSSSSYSCSCAGGDHEYLVGQSDYAFAGVVSEFWFDKFPAGEIHYVFDVTSTYKGDSRRQVEVVVKTMLSSSCGYAFSENSKYQIYADDDNGVLRTNSCGIRPVNGKSRSSPALLPQELDRKTLAQLYWTLPSYDIVVDKVSTLEASGCTFITYVTIGGECANEGRGGPLICDGGFTAAFSDIHGSTGQHDFTYRWNRETDDLTLSDTGDHDGYFIESSDCKSGIDPY